MHEFAKILDISGTDIVVEPLISDTCINCSQSCAKRGSPFPVKNSNGLPVEKGSVVRIAASAKNQAMQGILALLVPVGCAIGGYFLSGKLIAPETASRTAAESIQAGSVLLCLVLSTAAVLLIRKKLPPAETGIITEIIKSSDAGFSGSTCSKQPSAR